MSLLILLVPALTGRDRRPAAALTPDQILPARFARGEIGYDDYASPSII